jgi:hypothetical protein
LTHTFIAVKHKDGSIDTYSWGNTYDENGNGIWWRNHPNDLAAAHEALDKKEKMATKEGDHDLDPFVEEAFDEKRNDEDGKHQFFWENNCKHEADRLIDRAIELKEKDDSN